MEEASDFRASDFKSEIKSDINETIDLTRAKKCLSLSLSLSPHLASELSESTFDLTSQALRASVVPHVHTAHHLTTACGWRTNK